MRSLLASSGAQYQRHLHAMSELCGDALAPRFRAGREPRQIGQTADRRGEWRAAITGSRASRTQMFAEPTCEGRNVAEVAIDSDDEARRAAEAIIAEVGSGDFARAEQFVLRYADQREAERVWSYLVPTLTEAVQRLSPAISLQRQLGSLRSRGT